jgi:hypothetical protein
MAAHDSINARQKRWATLYRGLSGVTSGDVDLSQVGPHWTTNPHMAVNFALNRDVEGYPLDDEPAFGTVIEAKVHRRHIIDPESEEGQNWQFMNAVLGPDNIEREKTIRPGAPVHIQAMEELDDDTSKYLPVYKRGRA